MKQSLRFSLKYSTVLFFFTCCISPALLQAAVKIESRSQDGARSYIYTEGNQARIETARNNGYLVLDLQRKSLRLALPEQKAVLDMSDIFSTMSSTDHDTDGQYIDAYISSKGLGPRVAGYETEEYELHANNSLCGTALVSVKAIRETGFRKFFNVLNKLGTHIQQKMSAGMMPAHNLSVCNQAEIRLGNKLLDIGFPLRYTDNNTSNEVISIDKHASLPAGGFTIPADYKLTTPAQLMSGAAKKLMQHQPDMNQMMQMMKNLPPEAQELLRQQIKMMQR